MIVDDPDSQILLGEVITIAESGHLRVRAFGETRIWGEGGVFYAHGHDPMDLLEQGLSSGTLRVYRDREGLFVGPTNPSCIAG